MIYKSRWPLTPPEISLPSFIFGSSSSLSANDILFYDSSRPDTHNLTLSKFRRSSEQLAKGFVDAGLQPSDRVVLMSGNDLWIPVVVVGTLMAGGIYTSCNPANNVRETLNQLRDCQPRIIIVAKNCVPVILEAVRQLDYAKPLVYLFENSSFTPHDLTLNSYAANQIQIPHWSELLRVDQTDIKQDLNTVDEKTKSHQTAVLLYSSGTTGLPKGVEVTHYNLITTCQQLQMMQFSGSNVADRRVLCVLPMYHGLGLVYYCLVGPSVGLKTYIQPRFNLEDMVACIERYGITELLLVPPILLAMAKSSLCKEGSHKLKSVKKVVAGAAPLGLKITQEFESLWSGQVRVRQAWGMSELPCIGMCWNESEPVGPPSVSVGELVPGLCAKLLNEDGAEVSNAGESGELWISGPNVMKGYWRNIQATAETRTSDVWLRTGDIAYVDESSKWYIVDRKKELIKVRGAQVAPAELEALLMENPDIVDAAVIGITTENGDEQPRAYVVPRGSSLAPSEVQDFLSSKVSKIKRLTGGVVFVDSIPKNPSGKILRKLLREHAASASQPKSYQSKL